MLAELAARPRVVVGWPGNSQRRSQGHAHRHHEWVAKTSQAIGNECLSSGEGHHGSTSLLAASAFVSQAAG